MHNALPTHEPSVVEPLTIHCLSSGIARFQSGLGIEAQRAGETTTRARDARGGSPSIGAR